jgi:hypothetical protein
LILQLLLFSSASLATEREWTLVNESAEWTRRAGLQVLEQRGCFYLLGGRTPRPPSFPPIPGDSDIWGDVWRSDDRGESWMRILETDDDEHWPARAYFQAVKKGRAMYVLGGQNFEVIPNPDCTPPDPNCAPFISTSEFFNDVWRSFDGVNWEQMTDEAPWDGRAGLMAVTHRGWIFVLGGSFNDDPAVIGGPPTRVYFNDVWKSRNGRDWIECTDVAPWEARAGGAVVSKGEYMYLLGGENGFLCEPFPGCELPYFNDVWRSKDGENWDRVTESADWVPRPGHQAVVVKGWMVLFGGFGPLANPIDMWASRNGADWHLLEDAPWNAFAPSQIKYDFDALVSWRGHRPAIYTFGGDRETFDFTDPTNYLNVDNDVWRYGGARPRGRSTVPGNPELAGLRSLLFGEPASPHVLGRTDGAAAAVSSLELTLEPNTPNPFTDRTKISYSLPSAGHVRIEVHDASGRLVRRLVSEVRSGGRQSASWDGTDDSGRSVAAGVYFARIQSAGQSRSVRMMRLK